MRGLLSFGQHPNGWNVVTCFYFVDPDIALSMQSSSPVLNGGLHRSLARRASKGAFRQMPQTCPSIDAGLGFEVAEHWLCEPLFGVFARCPGREKHWLENESYFKCSMMLRNFNRSPLEMSSNLWVNITLNGENCTRRSASSPCLKTSSILDLILVFISRHLSLSNLNSKTNCPKNGTGGIDFQST